MYLFFSYIVLVLPPSACQPAPPLPPLSPAQRHTHTQQRPNGRAIKHHTRTQHSVCAPSQSGGAHPQRMRVTWEYSVSVLLSDAPLRRRHALVDNDAVDDMPGSCRVTSAQPRAWRSRVDDTISCLAVGHSGHAQSPASVPPALIAPPSLVPCRRRALLAAQLVPDTSRRPATLQHRKLLARRSPGAHDGADGGDLALGVPTSMCVRCTCLGLQGFLWTPASDRRASALGEAEPAK